MAAAPTAIAAGAGATALEESTAAAVGALGATLALYPLEVAKTRIQAEKASASAPSHGTLATCARIARTEGVAQLLAGVGPKGALTVVSNFAFYYFYESLKRLHARAGCAPGAASSLLLASLAGALNVCATHPMETVTTRVQAGGRDGDPPEGVASACAHIFAESGLRGFWRGFAASLVLVANPAINVTVFDALKTRLLAALARLRGRPDARLSAMHAFALGCAAKAVATVLTYPLIRVKVLQQSAKQQQRPPPPPAPPHASPSLGARQGDAWARAPGGGGASARARAPGMAELLREIWTEQGVRGMYVGCSAQLLTTVLKAGLLLMGKEQALVLALALLRPTRAPGRAPAPPVVCGGASVLPRRRARPM